MGTRANGFTGGGQIGYNYQINSGPAGGFVVGVEADASYANLDRAAVRADGIGDTSVFVNRTDFVGTVRGRIGYSFDNFLLYGTGGFAYGGVKDAVNFYGPGGPLFYAGNRDTIRTGYAYGGSVEYAIPTNSFLNVFNSSAVTVKAEFIHYDLGSSNLAIANVSGGAAIGVGYVERIRYSGNLVRGGLNFKFGSVIAPPVVARY